MKLRDHVMCVQKCYVVVDVQVEKLWAQADMSVAIRSVSVLVQGYGYGLGVRRALLGPRVSS